MKLWLVKKDHSRRVGGWTDRYLVNAETKEDAEKALDADDPETVFAVPVDMERLAKEPWYISDSSRRGIYWQDSFDEEKPCA